MVLILAGAYRSLGGGPARVEDAGALLTSAAATLRRALAALPDATDHSAFVAEAAPLRDGRRASAAAQQMLDRLAPSDDSDPSIDSVRRLLTAAADDASWAWRMLAGATVSPGILAAVATLADHAGACCDEAEALLAVPATGTEPLDGA